MASCEKERLEEVREKKRAGSYACRTPGPSAARFQVLLYLQRLGRGKHAASEGREDYGARREKREWGFLGMHY